jgi:hypothetical protein
MLNFLRLENLILPTTQIKTVTTPTLTNGDSIVEIAIQALTDVFKFDGQAAARVYSQLEGFTPNPVSVTARNIQVLVNGAPVAAEVIIPGEDIPASIAIDNQLISTDSIEWADLATDFGDGKLGVELRLSTDAPGTTRQYLGTNASEAYDVLAALVPEAVAAAQ